MRRVNAIGCGLIFTAVLLSAGSLQAASTAPPPFFGAALTKSSQPANAESGKRCADEVAGAGACSWVSVRAYQNAGRERAPRTGTIGSVSLVSCVAGSLRLQLATVNPGLRQAKVVRNGPLIRYRADPRELDADSDTFCGGEDGDDFIVQKFPVNLKVNKGEFIAIQAAKTGALYCSGGSGVLLYSPPLALGKAARRANETASCNLLVKLEYR
jgi:hypothetical protein